MCTYDFSTHYTTLPHDIIKKYLVNKFNILLIDRGEFLYLYCNERNERNSLFISEQPKRYNVLPCRKGLLLSITFRITYLSDGCSVVVDLMFIVTPIVGVCNCSMLCCALLYVHSSFAIILMVKRELIALLSLSSWWLMIVVSLFLLCHGFVCGLWLCYFLNVLTYYFWLVSGY